LQRPQLARLREGEVAQAREFGVAHAE
jgi:hypothetical protein